MTDKDGVSILHRMAEKPDTMTFPDRITILHISDFHYSGRKLRDQKMVVDALLVDVKTQCTGRKRPDIILFSGDLTNGPPIDSHDAAYDVLLDPILKITNTTNERLFIVPGNHDVEQVAVSDFKAEHLEWQAKSNELGAINDDFDKRKFNAAHDAKFANFLKLQSAISGERVIYSNPFCSVYRIEALNTDIVVLNSSMLSTGGHKEFGRDEGKMVIPEFAIAEALPYLKGGSFRLFTTHHPLTAFSEAGASYMARELERHANVHLFGHMHDPQTRQITGFEGKLLSNQAGAVFTHRTEYYIGYAIISVDVKTGFSETSLRTYFPQRDKFDDAVDKVAGGVFYNSDEARGFWEGLASPVDADAFRKHLAGPAFDALTKECLDLNILEANGRQQFVAPRLHVIDNTAGKDAKTQIDVPIAFNDLANGNENHIVYSPQEYGRTTLLREIQFHQLATADNSDTPRLPVMIDFSDVHFNLNQLLRTVKSRSLADPSAFDFETLLKNGNVCLLVDDVVFSDHRKMTVLRAFVAAYPKARYIFSSLKSSAANYGAHVILETPVRFEFVELCEMRRKEMRELVKRKLGEGGNVETVLDRLHSEIQEINLPFTAANGTIFMAIYERNNNFRPVNRSVVIEQFVDTTLRKGEVEQSHRETFDYSNKTSLLAHVAGWMARENCYEPSYEALRAAMKSYIDEFGLVTDLEKLFEEFFNARILMKRPDGQVCFRFRATLEYFIALHMTISPAFKDWVLDESRYLTYINEIQYYAGKVRNDAALVNLMGERFEGIVAELVAETGEVDINQIATIPVPRKGNSDSLKQLSDHLLHEPLTRDERDEVLEGDLPRDVEDRQGVFRPHIKHPGHKLMIGLILYSGLVKNMELIASSEKRRHLRAVWHGWSMFLNLSLTVVKELARDRKIRINGVMYEINAPMAMGDEELGRIIALNMPTSITRLIAASLGTEKLRLQLTEPDLDDQAPPLVVEFMRSSLIADLRLPETPGVIRALFKKLLPSDFLSEAFIWKVADLRKMDLISAPHFEAVTSELAGTIARLKGGTRQDIADGKRKQIVKLNREGVMLKIARSKDEN